MSSVSLLEAKLAKTISSRRRLQDAITGVEQNPASLKTFDGQENLCLSEQGAATRVIPHNALGSHCLGVVGRPWTKYLFVVQKNRVWVRRSGTRLSHQQLVEW